MRLEIKTFKSDDEIDIKTKVYECETMDADMKVSAKNANLESVLLDDVALFNEKDIDDLIEFLKHAKRAFR